MSAVGGQEQEQSINISCLNVTVEFITLNNFIDLINVTLYILVPVRLMQTIL